MDAYKLVRKRRDGTLGSLFIKRKAVLPVGTWLEAEDVPTTGYAHRPGWHCCADKHAPHLSKKGRVWVRVQIKDYDTHIRPAAQGGKWFTAQQMKILKEL